MKQNGECEICHHNWHYRVKPDNKYDGNYRAHDSPAKKLLVIIFILILAEEKLHTGLSEAPISDKCCSNGILQNF